MAEVQCLRIKIPPGKTEQTARWYSALNERRAEVYESMRAEGMILESLFLERAADGDYLILYRRAASIAAADAAFEASTLPIDQELWQFIAANLLSAAPLEFLVDFEP